MAILEINTSLVRVTLLQDSNHLTLKEFGIFYFEF